MRDAMAKSALARLIFGDHEDCRGENTTFDRESRLCFAFDSQAHVSLRN